MSRKVVVLKRKDIHKDIFQHVLKSQTARVMVNLYSLQQYGNKSAIYFSEPFASLDVWTLAAWALAEPVLLALACYDTGGAS